MLKQTIGKNNSDPGATVYDIASERLCWGISEGTAAFLHWPPSYSAKDLHLTGSEMWPEEYGVKEFPNAASDVLLKLNQEDVKDKGRINTPELQQVSCFLPGVTPLTTLVA